MIIKRLILKNFLVIRFTSINSKKLNFNQSENYIEFEITDEISKKIQFSLMSQSELIICYQGGIHSMNQIVQNSFYKLIQYLLTLMD